MNVNATRRVLLLLFLLSVPLPAHAIGREDVGTVDKLEVNGLTRKRASFWVRATLPRVPAGYRQTFTGAVSVSNVMVPFRQPATVMVQPKAGANEAVFYVDVDLDKIPRELLPNFGPHAIALELSGTMKGDKGAESQVFAVGVLKLGSRDITAPSSFASTFVRYEGAGLTGVSLTETSGEAKVALFNPLSFEIVVVSLDYTVTVHAGDRTLTTGSVRNVKLAGGKETEVVLPLSARNTDLVAAAGTAILTGGTVDGRLVGRAVLRSGNGTLTVPVDVSGPIRVTR